MSFIRKFYRWSCAGVLLTVGALWSVSLSAASGLPAGTFVLDVANKTQSFGDVSETVKEVRKNRCQLNQNSLTIMTYDAGADEVSRGDQKQAFGIKTQGQDCGFAGEGQAWTFVPGAEIPDAAEIGGWVIDFIVTDDAVFEIVLLNDSGVALQLLDASGAPKVDGSGAPVKAFKIYSGRSACSGGSPITPADWEQVVFPCVAQSNPNSDFGGQAGFRPGTSLNTFGSNLSLPEGVRQIRIDLTEAAGGSGNVGVTAAQFDFELVPDGVLTCEQPGAEQGPVLTDPLEFEGIFDVGDGVQCRRLPNRGPTACEAVPYILDANCEGEVCEFEFLHGDQSDGAGGLLDRSNYAFVCEVWWPSQPGDFADEVPNDPIVPRTQVFWGGLTSPSVRGDDLNWCAGITPVFSGSTCGTQVVYKLSDDEDFTTVTDGGTVSPTDASCSLLDAYDDFLVPAPPAGGDEPDDGIPDDQCRSDGCPGGSDSRQLACLGQQRIVLEEDTGVTPVVAPGGGRITAPANPTYRKYELILIEGDIRLRGFR